MGIGAVGGVLESTPAELAFTDVKSAGEKSQPSSFLSMMWEKWANEIETWSNVKMIADRAMGSVMASHHLSSKKATLESTVVPWTAVQSAWVTHNTSKATYVKSHEIADNMAAEQEDPSKTELGKDKVVESVKNDPDLDPHEHRLISCIVDPSTSSVLKTSCLILKLSSQIQ
jgi:hypothetical protein